MTRSAARRAKALADVVTAYDQVLAVVGAAADEHVDMGVVGVPMIHCDPVEPRSEVALRVLHQLAREGPKVGKLARVLRRDCEPEMMPVPFAPFGESLRVGVVGGASNIRASAPSRVTPSRFR